MIIYMPNVNGGDLKFILMLLVNVSLYQTHTLNIEAINYINIDIPTKRIKDHEEEGQRFWRIFNHVTCTFHLRRRRGK